MRTDPAAGTGFRAHLARSASGEAVVTVFGELDLSSSRRLREVLARALERGTDIELDLRSCDFVDSSGIAVLAWAAWRLKERGLVLCIRGAGERISRILEVSGLAGHSSIRLEPFEARSERRSSRGATAPPGSASGRRSDAATDAGPGAGP